MLFLDVSQYCKDLQPIINLIKSVITLLQIGIPIALILFGMIDLGKAVIAGKEDEMKKAQSTLIKRVIYAVAVFLVVTIVSLVINLVAGAGAENSGNANDWRQCWGYEGD